MHGATSTSYTNPPPSITTPDPIEKKAQSIADTCLAMLPDLSRVREIMTEASSEAARTFLKYLHDSLPQKKP